MMNRTTLGKKNFNRQRPRVDRFVTPRECLPELSRKVRWGARDNGNDDVWCTKHLKEKKYAKYLDTAFGLEPIKSVTSSDSKEYLQFWPCIPRTMSYLSSADSILDLPSYSDATFPELLDWSNDNILVAALGSSYHKWSWRTQSQISQGFTEYDIRCCKFDPKGKLLLLGTDAKTVEIHDTELNKRVDGNKCRCYHLTPPYDCSITATDWSPTGNSFTTGCSRGYLVSYRRDGRRISFYDISRGSIFIIRVSPDARYVTATSVNDDDVLVLTWPFLQLFSRLTSDWTIKALSWHPWRSALLGIGAVTSTLNARVTLWDAPTGKVRKHSISRNQCSLDAMLFSERTGELVLSLWNADTELSYPNTNSHLVVMSDPETVVDQWGEGWTRIDRIRTMVFSPDGTKLATATTAEDLIILNFLPEDKRNKKFCKRFYAMPVNLDKVTMGVPMR